ncbi:spore germination protein GerPB [Bacillus massiliglaciei]|uniref:spore germination protein GerPB n=1 Tax=Bacillus massiliglaciei TaxID=1816693 RepID=UPI000A40C41E|nr:spore germination protein GerPB [Bacillus massiliglaciei]
MNFNIQQTIHINMIKIESISNSSVFQIGSAGVIKPHSILSNTGGFTEPAPELNPEYGNEVSFTPFTPTG